MIAVYTMVVIMMITIRMFYFGIGNRIAPCTNEHGSPIVDLIFWGAICLHSRIMGPAGKIPFKIYPTKSSVFH